MYDIKINTIWVPKYLINKYVIQKKKKRKKWIDLIAYMSYYSYSHSIREQITCNLKQEQ